MSESQHQIQSTMDIVAMEISVTISVVTISIRRI